MTRAFPNWDQRGFPIPAQTTRFPNGGNGYSNPAADPYYDQVSFLMNMEGTHGEEDAVDLSQYAHTITYVSADVQSTHAKFGETSLRTFGGGQYIRADDHDSFSMGSNDYTFENWYYTDVNSAGVYMSKYNLSISLAEYFFWHDGVELNFLYFYGTGANSFIFMTQSWDVNTGSWNHVATDRVGDDFFMYHNGQMISSLNHTGLDFANKGDTFRMGARNHSNDLPFDGWIDDARVTKGTGRYGGVNFTPIGPNPLF